MMCSDYATYCGCCPHQKLISKTRGAGGLNVLAVDLNADTWTRLLTGGLATAKIALLV